MIERKFVSQQGKEYRIQEFISHTLKNVGHSCTKVMRTPLGERIVIYASRPGLVVGRKGENIKKLTGVLKKRFGLENPQIEINEVSKPDLDAQIVAERIASTLERFGVQRFKAVGHKTLDNVIRAGALGVEILISGKIPSARARTWRFYKGYLKKSGEIAVTGVRKAYAVAHLKVGAVGVQVTILPREVQRPDDVHIVDNAQEVVEEVVEEEKEKPKKKTKKKTTQKTTRKTTQRKTAKKKATAHSSTKQSTDQVEKSTKNKQETTTNESKTTQGTE